MNQYVPSHQYQFIDKELHHGGNSHIHFSSPVNINHANLQTPSNIHESLYSTSPQLYNSPGCNSPLPYRTSPIPSSKITSQTTMIPKFHIDTSKCLNNYNGCSSPSSPTSSHNISLVPSLNVNNSNVNFNSLNNSPRSYIDNNNNNINHINHHINNNNNNSDIPISTCIPLLKLKSLPSQGSIGNNNSTSSNNSPRSIYYVPECGDLSPFPTPNQSPRNINSSLISNQILISSTLNNTIGHSQPSSLSNTPLSSPRGSNQSPQSSNIDKIGEHWRKLEHFTKDLNNFVADSIKSKDFTNLQELSEKVEEVKNSMKEIEIINSIAKTLPPQTRARKNRSTKAEKLQKDRDQSINPIIKRTYVTTPKSKGNHCSQCGTLETPEWRKGPGGHKTLCNACGLHYAKNLKREHTNKKVSPSTPVPNPKNKNTNIEHFIGTSHTTQLTPPVVNNMKIENLLE